MADDAFALSPISARPSMPTDADYDAICEAFMETARGRWFLAEYAKRNRNADTRAVLDAVGRLEDLIAAGKSGPKADEEPPPHDDPRLALAQATIETFRNALQALDADIGKAQAALARVRDASEREPLPAVPEATLDAIRHAGQMVQGVAWTLRESGADGRICTLLDMQARAIAEGHAGLVAIRAPEEPAKADSEGFDVADAGNILGALRARIVALLGDVVAPPSPATPNASDVVELDDTPVMMPHPSAQGDASEQRVMNSAPFPQAGASGPSAPHIVEPAELEWAEHQQGQEPEPLTLGDVLAGEGIAPATKPAMADPFAPFARMSPAERRAFFS